MTERGGLAERGPWLLVLDVGSSSARAWLYDRSARGLDPGPAARQRYRWRSVPAGVMESDAGTLLEGAAAAVDGALAVARWGGAEIEAVAVTTFWHSLLGVDAGGEPTTAVLAWGDARAAGEAVRLVGELDEAAVHRRTGCFLHPSYPSVKLSWLRRAEPELFARTAAWLSFAEHLEWRLFGRRRVSYSMASGSGLLDVHRLRWDGEWLERLGLDEGGLSELVDTDAPIRGLLPEFAERWPELAAVDWYPAVGDGACAALGSGAAEPGSLSLTIGTSAAIRAVWEAEEVEIPSSLWCYRLDGRRWVVGEALSNGGNAIARLRRTLVLPPPGELEAALASMAPDAHGLTVLPYMVPERGAGWLGETHAAVVGLTAATTPEQQVRAWMEAIAYRLARGCERLEAAVGRATHVYASGGALEGSPAWSGILADALDRPVLLPAEPEATTRGAALLALECRGLALGVEAAEPDHAVRFEPDPERHGRHREARRRHEALAEALAPWFDRELAGPR